MLVPVNKWTMYDLGLTYKFCTDDYTYVRLVFVYPIDQLDPGFLLQNNITPVHINPLEAAITADITSFARKDIHKLKLCVSESIEALINTADENKVLVEFIKFFIKNFDLDNAQYIPIELNSSKCIGDARLNPDPLKVIYKNISEDLKKGCNIVDLAKSFEKTYGKLLKLPYTNG